jgi:thioredoxin-related protein
MNTKSIPVVLAALSLFTASTGAATWLTDLPSALSQAKGTDKLILINFTGSDWCGWCIKLRQEVFSQPEFDTFATDELVLVEVDFPRRKQLSAEQRTTNQALADQFGIKGFPTIVILDNNGKRRGMAGYMPGGPKVFLSMLRKLQGLKGAQLSDEPAPATKKALPLFGGAPIQPPPRYAQLTLKGISGPANRRMALINNQTLGAGEAGRVKLGEGEVQVRCLEIRDKSVVVLVEGETERRELRLRIGL